MSKIKIPGVGSAEGMKQLGPLPPGEYLLKVTKVETKDKTDNGLVTGTTFVVTSQVLGAEKLPPTEAVRDYVDRPFSDFIFVMSPNHAKYEDVATNGTQIGMIGVNTLKSWLVACGVVIKNDEFDESKAIGKWYEARIGTRPYKDREGNDRVGNQVYEYRVHEDEAVADAAPDAVEFEDDIIK